MVPDAKLARLRGLPTVPVSDCVTVPVFVAPGGLRIDVIGFCATVELFLTVITRRKLTPATSDTMGVPDKSVIWNTVIASDFSVQEPGVFVVVVPTWVSAAVVV